MELYEKIKFLEALIHKQYRQDTLLQDNFQKKYRKLYLIRRISELIFIILIQSINIFFDNLPNANHYLEISSAVNLMLVFWRGRQVFWGIFLGNLLIFTAYTKILFAIKVAIINSFTPIIIIFLCHKLIGPILPFARIKDWLGYVFCCVIVSILLLPIFLMQIPINDALIILYRKLCGFILITPAVLIWGSYPFINKIFTKWQLLTIVSATFGTIISSIYAFNAPILGTLFSIIICGLTSIYAGLPGIAIVFLGQSAILIFAGLAPTILNKQPNEIMICLYLLLLTSITYIVSIIRAQKHKANNCN